MGSHSISTKEKSIAKAKGKKGSLNNKCRGKTQSHVCTYIDIYVKLKVKRKMMLWEQRKRKETQTSTGHSPKVRLRWNSLREGESEVLLSEMDSPYHS